MMEVLFVCVHNSGRSQMAEAFLRHLGWGKVQAASAGTEAADAVNPVVVVAMEELGVPMTGQRPKLLTQEMADRASHVITMGCNVEEACPARVVVAEDWVLPDPEGQPLGAVREIRDEIRRKVVHLLAELEQGE